jgi:hypothetical protein
VAISLSHLPACAALRRAPVDPDKIVSIYRDAIGLDEAGELPSGVTCARMIEAILDREEIDQLSAKVIRGVAG